MSPTDVDEEIREALGGAEEPPVPVPVRPPTGRWVI